MSEPTILGKYVDALYLSVAGALQEPLERRLRVLKGSLRGSGSNGARVPVPRRCGVPGGALKLRPYGRGKSQYVLENDRVYLELSTWENLPALQIQWKAEALYEYDLAGLEKAADALCALFLAPGHAVPKVARCDIAVDFHPAPGWRAPAVEDVVCRARRRAIEYDGTRALALTLGSRAQPLQAQLYEKSREILSSGKEWMREVWGSSGFFNPERPVWRAELRFYRRYLRELVRPDDPYRSGVDSISDLRESLGDLVSSALGGYEDAPGTWLRFAESATRGENTSRRASAGWWSVVRAAFLADEISSGRVRLAGDPHRGQTPRYDLEKSLRRIGSMSAKAAAAAQMMRLHSAEDPQMFFNWMLYRFVGYLRSGGGSWERLVREKRETLEDVLLEVDPGYVWCAPAA